jgi:hypothetical protein
MLAIIRALEEWRAKLQREGRFDILPDHQAVQKEAERKAGSIG